MKDDCEVLAKALAQGCRGRLKRDEPLSAHTSIRIGGPADIWFEPEDEASLADALRMVSGHGVSVHMVGGGSNLLAPDAGLRGLSLHLSSPAFKTLRADGDRITAGAAVSLGNFLSFLVENGFGHCEFLAGIPAQIGGAVMMNAGSAHAWIGDHTLRVRGIDFEGRSRELDAREIPFRYRSSGLGRFVVTEAEFHFPKAAAGGTRARLAEYSEYRRKTQDLRHPSAGCMFRNPPPPGTPAGGLIERAGLKGKRDGQAQISLIHANFVVNLGGATQAEVLRILELAEETVFDRFRVRLEREIRVL